MTEFNYKQFERESADQSWPERIYGAGKESAQNNSAPTSRQKNEAARLEVLRYELLNFESPANSTESDEPDIPLEIAVFDQMQDDFMTVCPELAKQFSKVRNNLEQIN